jgi:uncharacterized protein YjbI with pentapeptide repeats
MTTMSKTDRPCDVQASKTPAFLSWVIMGLAISAALWSAPALAADMSAGQVTQALFKAKAGETVNLAAKNLRELDLAGIDFKGANLAGSDLYGVDLSNANLKGVDLKGAFLDRANVARADFSGANLEGGSLLRMTIFTTLERNPLEAPKFKGAKMQHTVLSGWMDGTDFSDCDLTGAVFGLQDAHNEGLLASRVRLVGADFSGATMTGVNLNGSQLTHAHFVKAIVRDVDFRDADLIHADFTDADVTGMDVTGANLEDAKFTGAKGIDTIKGLAQALNATHVVAK